MREKNQTIELLKIIQISFPMVFVALAFGFYLNDRLPALMAWVFAAVGFIEYCLLGVLRYNLKSIKAKALSEA